MKHRVCQGEHLCSIAARYGFASWKQVWDHSGNAALRSRRRDPNVLLPGDIVHVPEREARTEFGPTGRRHLFRTRRSQLLLRIDARDLNRELDGEPELLLRVGSMQRRLTPNQNGVMETHIPVRSSEAVLRIGGFPIPLRIGDLDPLDIETGQRERLRNLGYLQGGEDEDAETLASAVLRFQADHDLVCDGICGPETQQKLLETHGS